MTQPSLKDQSSKPSRRHWHIATTPPRRGLGRTRLGAWLRRFNAVLAAHTLLYTPIAWLLGILTAYAFQGALHFFTGITLGFPYGQIAIYVLELAVILSVYWCVWQQYRLTQIAQQTDLAAICQGQQDAIRSRPHALVQTVIIEIERDDEDILARLPAAGHPVTWITPDAGETDPRSI